MKSNASTATEGGEGESAGVAEAVEEAVATGEVLHQLAVLALVDKETRLLPFEEVDEQTVAVLCDFPLLRFYTPQIAVIAATGHSGRALIEDGLEAVGIEFLLQYFDKQGEQFVHPYRVRLKDKDAVVPVGDETGEVVAFGMDHPEDVSR